jgi:hypothetical protein
LVSTSSLQSVRYKTICKVGTGYSFAQLEELRNKLNPVKIPWDTNNKNYLPKHFCPWRIGKLDDVPNFWIPPEKSIVVELKCAEIVASNQFSAGYTCRFPRLRKIRYDKDASEVMSLDDIVSIVRNPRMKTHEVEDMGGGKGGRSKRKKDDAAMSIEISDVVSSLLPQKVNGRVTAQQFTIHEKKAGAQLTDNILEGQVFCVLENEYTRHNVKSSDLHSLGETDNQILSRFEVSKDLSNEYL